MLMSVGVSCTASSEVEGSPGSVVTDPAASLRADLLDDPLAYTRHAECRMGCRQVTVAEVESVLATGEWKPERSRTDGACPSHALEGKGTDGHALRIVFAACEDETRVVTAIDLDQDWPCDCD